MDSQLQNKLALITGSTGGIGLAIAEKLPQGRVAEIEDVAPTFLHVLESTYLNGANIPVNGGGPKK